MSATIVYVVEVDVVFCLFIYLFVVFFFNELKRACIGKEDRNYSLIGLSTYYKSCFMFHTLC